MDEFTMAHLRCWVSESGPEMTKAGQDALTEQMVAVWGEMDDPSATWPQVLREVLRKRADGAGFTHYGDPRCICRDGRAHERDVSECCRA